MVPGRREARLSAGGGSAYFVMTAASCAGEGPRGADPARGIAASAPMFYLYLSLAVALGNRRTDR